MFTISFGFEPLDQVRLPSSAYRSDSGSLLQYFAYGWFCVGVGGQELFRHATPSGNTPPFSHFPLNQMAVHVVAWLVAANVTVDSEFSHYARQNPAVWELVQRRWNRSPLLGRPSLFAGIPPNDFRKECTGWWRDRQLYTDSLVHAPRITLWRDDLASYCWWYQPSAGRQFFLPAGGYERFPFSRIDDARADFLGDWPTQLHTRLSEIRRHPGFRNRIALIDRLEQEVDAHLKFLALREQKEEAYARAQPAVKPGRLLMRQLQRQVLKFDNSGRFA